MMWMWKFVLTQVMIAYAQVFVPENGATYNSLVGQVGYCKQQSFDTVSRSTSNGPSLFTSGRVFMGVGLSHVQFQRSIISCGQCIRVLHVDKFYQLDNELTSWNYNHMVKGGFTTMVFDECTDPICTDGFLDFDLYNPEQPVAQGNPNHLMWMWVDCPVDVEKDKIEFLFCLGYDSCKANDEEGRDVKSLWEDAVRVNDFMAYPRNFRQPIVSMSVQGDPLEDIQSWRWNSVTNGSSLLQNKTWMVEWQSMDGSRQNWTIMWDELFSQNTTSGYRGGVIVQTNLQN